MGVAGTAANASAVELKPWSSISSGDQDKIRNLIGGLGVNGDGTGAGSTLVGEDEATASGVLALQEETGASVLGAAIAGDGLAIATVGSGVSVLGLAGVLTYELTRPTLGPWIAGEIFGRAPPSVDPSVTSLSTWHSVPTDNVGTTVNFSETPNITTGITGPYCTGIASVESSPPHACNTSDGWWLGGGVLCVMSDCSYPSAPYESVLNAISSSSTKIKRYYNAGQPSCGCGSVMGASDFVFVDQADWSSVFKNSVCPDFTCWTGGGSPKVATPVPLNKPSPTPTGATLDGPSNCDDASAQTTEQAAACTWIADKVPGAVASPIIGLFDPMPDETYSDYILRLQGEGYVGTGTTTVEPTALPGYGPNSPTRVIIPVQSGEPVARVYDPLRWPGVDPTFDKHESLTIRYNPSTATPAPTDPAPTPDPTGGGTNTGGAGGSGCTPPTVPALDFTALNGHSLSGKFPFAIFSWLSGIVSDLNTTGAAPTFTIPIHLGAIGVDKTLPVDLSSADDMMSYLRPILAGFTLLGAIIFLTTGALGWGARAPTATGE